MDHLEADRIAAPGVLVPPSLALNRRLPLWYQVAQSLRAMILCRSADDPLRLPTEAALARHYGVSLITLREALKSLEEERLVARHRRRGTFVNPAAPSSPPLKLMGSLETVMAQQSSAEVTVLEQRRVAAPGFLAEHFPGVAELTLFRRLRKERGVPVSYAENYVLPEYGERVAASSLERWPMTKILRDEVGVAIARVEDSVEAQLATPEIARLLEVGLASAILFFTGVSRDTRGRVVDVARIHYRGDRARFAVAFDVG
jgi:GntR family transcriptional regulator